MFPFRRIFVADLSPALDIDLLRYAAGVAALGPDTEVIVTSVCSERALRPLALRSLTPASRTAFAGQDKERLSCQVLVNPGVQGLLSAVSTSEADLFLVRHPGASGAGQGLARQLMAASPCSIWMVPDGVAPRWRHVAVEMGSSAASTPLLSLACALGRRAGAEVLSAIHVTVSSTMEKIEALREQRQQELQCMIARQDVGDMECVVHMDEGVFTSRAFHRTARRQRADLLVTASHAAGGALDYLGRSGVGDLIEPGPSALLGVHLPQPRSGWRQLLGRVFSATEPSFN